jgi:hypothetical protein
VISVVILQAALAAPALAADRIPRFQLEVFGGFSTLSCADLNLLVDSDNRIHQFFFDSYLTRMTATGQIQRWESTREGRRNKVKSGVPFGLRLKYNFNRSLAVSVGIKTILGRRSSELRYGYDQYTLDGDRFHEEKEIPVYSLSVQGLVPQVGIHFARGIQKNLSIEGFLTGGPFFGWCRYINEWEYALSIQQSGSPYVVFTEEGRLEEEGKGTGIAAEAGLRLNWDLQRNLGAFLETGYAYQKVKRVSGGGEERLTAESKSWEGRWVIRSERASTYWGDLEVEFPTNYWPAGNESRWVRNFTLDLSGFQVKLGFFFRF